MSRKHILDAIDASLKRLQTDYVDLYQLHSYDPTTPIDEALEALDTVVKSGKARYVGVSNWPAYKVARALGRAELKGWAGITSRAAALQPALPHLRARPAAALRARRGSASSRTTRWPAACSPASTRKAAPPEGTRFTLGTAGARYQERYWHDREFETVEQLKGVAAEAGMSMATMAVSWVLANPAITAPIVGASRPEQLADSLAAAEKADAGRPEGQARRARPTPGAPSTPSGELLQSLSSPSGEATRRSAPSGWGSPIAPWLLAS